MQRPFVSIVMPALNEARHIEAAIESIRPFDADCDDYELLVVDGGSHDGTQAIVARLQAADPRVRLLDNPRRTQAAAMNLAAREADPRASVLLRADCHGLYPAGFVRKCLDAMAAIGAASVAVPMETVGRSCMQRAIAAAQNSRLGNGGSRHRQAGASGFVDHGHHAAFDRKVFVSLGGYCEDMPANEDAEFDTRLIAAGHRIWLCGEATMTYFPRSTLPALARQYFAYGIGRASTCVRHKIIPKARQLIPVASLLGCLFSFALAFVDVRFLVLALAYGLLCIAWGAALAWRDKDICALLAGPAAITMHLAWGAGFVTRIFREAASRLIANRARAGSRGADSRRA